MIDTLSVALICQNEEETLPAVFESLVPLAGLLTEVGIVDGGSRDGTLDVIAHYAQTIPVVYKQFPFDTFSAQKNRALELCRGDYVIGLDADHAFTSLTFKPWFEAGEHRRSIVWDWALWYCKGDLEHFEITSNTGMPTTRMWKNCGLRYEREVHEYLVMPGEHGWNSIHRGDRIQATDLIAILELQMLKSEKALRNYVERYTDFRERSREAGIPLPTVEQKLQCFTDPWANTAPIPENVLRGVPQGVKDLPIARRHVR